MAARRFRSVVDFARDLERELSGIGGRLDVALRVAARELYDDARELMSGRISLRELRRLGHPYARRIVRRKGRVGARVPVLPVNVQSGRLRRSLRAEVYRRGRLRVVELSVSTPYARFVMEGTRKMVARPLRREMEKRVRAVAKFLEGSVWR